MESIDKKIVQRRARLEEIKTLLLRLENERTIVGAELHAYEDARSYYVAETQGEFQSITARPTERKGGGISRTLSGQWLEIMRGVGHMDNFTVDDVLASAKINGHEPTRDNVRSQLHNYKKRKFAVAAGFGKYALTDLGKVQIGFGKDKKNAAPPAAEGEAANGSGALTPDFGGSHPLTQT